MKMIRAILTACIMFAVIFCYFYVMHNLEDWYTATMNAWIGEPK